MKISDYEFTNESNEADRRFQDYYANDPFPNVPAALLNADDVYNYIRVTSMIQPFSTDEKRLKEKIKQASVELDFLGDVHVINEEGKEDVIPIEPGTVFKLKHNAIAFVYLKTEFRLPTYIAARFNLRITHVHRGLLLGTGPIVDPGFKGRLLIPLHNLTARDYLLEGGEGLIWVEFTKLSACTSDDNADRKALPVSAKLPDEKINQSARKYFFKAGNGEPAESTLPDITRKVDSLRKGGYLALVLTVLGLLVPVWSLIHDVHTRIDSVTMEAAQARQATSEDARNIDRLAQEQQRLSQETVRLAAESEKFRAQLEVMRKGKDKSKDGKR